MPQVRNKPVQILLLEFSLPSSPDIAYLLDPHKTLLCHKAKARSSSQKKANRKDPVAHKKIVAQESLSVGHGEAVDQRCYFRNGESNPGLQGENLLS